jgi:hypothetical protein
MIKKIVRKITYWPLTCRNSANRAKQQEWS